MILCDIFYDKLALRSNVNLSPQVVRSYLDSLGAKPLATIERRVSDKWYVSLLCGSYNITSETKITHYKRTLLLR